MKQKATTWGLFTFPPAPSRKMRSTGQLGLWKTIALASVFCAATAIACPADSFKILATFDGTNGANPAYGFLVQGFDGELYGTTYGGGANGYGTVFKITPDGRLTTLYSFCSHTNCTDGSNPYAGLVQATDGNFYGTTSIGGANRWNGLQNYPRRQADHALQLLLPHELH